MSLQNPYCTVEDVLTDLKLSADSAQEGSKLLNEIERAINDASRIVDRWMGRDFYKHDYTVTPLEIDEFDNVLIDGEKLWLPCSPCLTLTAVTVAGVAWTSGTDYVRKDITYSDLSTACCLIALGEDWDPYRASGRVISVTGSFGYAQASETSVPTGLPHVIGVAASQLAAMLSGHNRKEVVGLDGAKVEITDREMNKLCREILGPKAGSVMT